VSWRGFLGRVSPFFPPISVFCNQHGIMITVSRFRLPFPPTSGILVFSFVPFPEFLAFRKNNCVERCFSGFISIGWRSGLPPHPFEVREFIPPFWKQARAVEYQFTSQETAAGRFLFRFPLGPGHVGRQPCRIASFLLRAPFTAQLSATPAQSSFFFSPVSLKVMGGPGSFRTPPSRQLTTMARLSPPTTALFFSRFFFKDGPTALFQVREIPSFAG